MKMGVAGFPGSGKTTIFNALTGLSAEVGPGSSAAGKPNLGVIKVPDARVDRLSELFSPKKTTYAEMSFVDFPDPVGETRRLDPKVITQMREVDALAHVVRAFTDPTQAEDANPIRDLESLATELVVADLTIVEKRLERVRKEKGKERERDLLARVVECLESEKELRHVDFLPEEETALSGFGLLSRKPRLVVLNVAESAVGQGVSPDLLEWTRAAGLDVLEISGKVEMELAELEPDERRAFEQDLGLAESARDRFIQASYSLLQLMSFLTAGEDEVRAWTIRRGDSALVAAGKIHSDIQRGFIRAEVMACADLLELGSEARCREAGKLRLEGKEYVVADGDVVHFRFNV